MPNVTPTVDCPAVISSTSDVLWLAWTTRPTRPPSPTTGIADRHAVRPALVDGDVGVEVGLTLAMVWAVTVGSVATELRPSSAAAFELAELRLGVGLLGRLLAEPADLALQLLVLRLQ